MVFFFFSSRRRHTRCSRDWSSDVCSSDLLRQTHRADHELAKGGGGSQLGGQSLFRSLAERGVAVQAHEVVCLPEPRGRLRQEKAAGVCPGKVGVSSGSQTHQNKSQSSVAGIAGREGN